MLDGKSSKKLDLALLAFSARAEESFSPNCWSARHGTILSAFHDLVL